MSESPGRICPLRYRYGTVAPAAAPDKAEALYVIGAVRQADCRGTRRRHRTSTDRRSSSKRCDPDPIKASAPDATEPAHLS
ncbi:MAG: hypothetical protein ABTR54_11060 [Candidatus Competibacter sp.]